MHLQSHMYKTGEVSKIGIEKSHVSKIYQNKMEIQKIKYVKIEEKD